MFGDFIPICSSKNNINEIQFTFYLYDQLYAIFDGGVLIQVKFMRTSVKYTYMSKSTHESHVMCSIHLMLKSHDQRCNSWFTAFLDSLYLFIELWCFYLLQSSANAKKTSFRKLFWSCRKSKLNWSGNCERNKNIENKNRNNIVNQYWEIPVIAEVFIKIQWLLSKRYLAWNRFEWKSKAFQWKH